jgi:3-oxoacyl-[acyl-carrier protein] reductase
MGRLANKVAFITGAGSGMGKSMAQVFAREGAKVAVVDVNGKAAAEVALSIGLDAIAIECDVSSKAAVDEALQTTIEAFDTLDILINNAGVTHVNKPISQIEESEFDRVFAVNVKGVFLLSQAAAPLMKKNGGVIINIGSTAGLRPRPGLSAYNATKGAVHNLTKTLAVELAPDKIRVCAIAPVATETPLLPSFLGHSNEMKAKFIATVPLGRLALPQDIADTALFLASDEAGFLTGNIVEVDGGRCV